jgi:hypothetical protein
MTDLAFYDAGFHDVRGLRRVVLPARRLLRRILRPFFFRQLAIYQDIYRRLEAQAEAQTQAHRALLAELRSFQQAVQLDDRAVARRLAALEDRVEAILSGAPPHGSDDAGVTIPLRAPDESRGLGAKAS